MRFCEFVGQKHGPSKPEFSGFLCGLLGQRVYSSFNVNCRSARNQFFARDHKRIYSFFPSVGGAVSISKDLGGKTTTTTVCFKYIPLFHSLRKILNIASEDWALLACVVNKLHALTSATACHTMICNGA